MRLLGWGGRNGKGGSRWGAEDFLGDLLLVYLLEVIDATSFYYVGVSRRKWHESLRTAADKFVLTMKREIPLDRRWDIQKLEWLHLCYKISNCLIASFLAVKRSHSCVLRGWIMKPYRRYDCLSSEMSLPPITSIVALQIQPLATDFVGRRNNDRPPPLQTVLALLNPFRCGQAYFHCITRRRFLKMSHVTLFGEVSSMRQM